MNKFTIYGSCLNSPIHQSINPMNHPSRPSRDPIPVAYGPGFCGGRMSGLFLSSRAGDGHEHGFERAGLGGIFMTSSIQLTLSRRSIMVRPCSSSLNEVANNVDSARPTRCSKNTRVSAIRSSRTASFRSNGARKLRISWICLRISSNAFSILIYKNDLSAPHSLFRRVGYKKLILKDLKCQTLFPDHAIRNTHGNTLVSREDREVPKPLPHPDPLSSRTIGVEREQPSGGSIASERQAGVRPPMN